MTLPEPEVMRHATARAVAIMRISRRLTQCALAERAGLSQNAVSEIEAAKRGVTLYTFFRLAYALNLAPEQFLLITIDQIGMTGPLPRLGPGVSKW